VRLERERGMGAEEVQDVGAVHEGWTFFNHEWTRMNTNSTKDAWSARMGFPADGGKGTPSERRRPVSLFV